MDVAVGDDPKQAQSPFSPLDVAEVSLGEVFRRYPVGKLVLVITGLLAAGLGAGF